jgi:hypothetical protein
VRDRPDIITVIKTVRTLNRGRSDIVGNAYADQQVMRKIGIRTKIVSPTDDPVVVTRWTAGGPR